MKTFRSVIDLDKVLNTTSGEELLSWIDTDSDMGLAILERAFELYQLGKLPERLGFCVDEYMGTKGW